MLVIKDIEVISYFNYGEVKYKLIFEKKGELYVSPCIYE